MNISLEKLDKYDYMALGTFIFFLLVFLIGVIAPGTFLDRLTSYRNIERRFFGVADGLFLISLIPFLILIETLHKYLIKYETPSKRNKYVVGFLLLGLIFGYSVSAIGANTTVHFDQPVVHHVVFVTFDGTRYDVFRQATQRIQEIKAESARAEYAISTYPTITYPSHTSMLTGAPYTIHGVLDNKYYEVHAQTIFDVLSSYGLKNAIITPASTLANMLAAKGGLAPTDIYTGDQYADMGTVTQKAIELLDEGYSFMRIHYVESDETGHEFGASSEQYKAVIAAQQMELKKIVDHLQETGMRNDTVIIVTADHGMFVNKHHHIRPQFVDHVPRLILGGKVKPMEMQHVSTLDVAPTIALLLGVDVPKNAVGVALGEPFGKPNVYCDTGSLKLNAFLSALGAALLVAATMIVIEDKLLSKFSRVSS